MRKTFLVLAVLGAASMADAQTVFDNINGYTWGAGNTTAGWALSGTSQFVAQQFKAGATGTIGLVELSVQQTAAGSSVSSGKIGLFTDNANTMGTMIGTEQVFNSSPTWNSGSILSVSGQASWQVTANTNYWIRAIPDTASDMNWRYTSTPVNGYIAGKAPSASTWNYFSNQPVAGMRITAVPEPATVSFLGLGLLGLARKRKQTAR